MRSTKPSLVSSITLLAYLPLLLVGTGCTHIQRPTIKPTALAESAGVSKIPLRVALVMDPAWTNYTFSFSKMGDTWQYPVGKALVEYARNATGHAFREVAEFSDAAVAANTADVVLQPRVGKADHAMGMLAWQDRTLVFRVEWTMHDAANRNKVWLSTIDGHASHHAGNVFTMNGNERKLFQQLFDDLTTKTVHAFQEAPELRQLSHAP